ncbi:TlpA family protein disulfide reductase [Sphingobacterium tabacisoli]|uniref:TlpA family protein disulfide reductase n=1 Tax=Sphingobacterium tabacisoli TaxID=2044855 RepID=A0ABW5L061_9SPHI|nr:hypothetical protein [Sphingobacterium tabacisoli]
MMNFNKGGRGLLFLEDDVSFIPTTIKTLSLTIIYCVLFSMALVTPAQGQEATGLLRIKPLSVGQKVPDDFWTKEHLFYINGDTVRKTFEEHRGKMVVLDFWFSGCFNCLLHQNEIDFFKEKYADELVVVMVNTKRTKEDQEKLNRFTKSEAFLNLKLSNLISVIEDDYLERLFAPSAYPSYCWINDIGLYQLKTFRNLLDRQYIAPFIDKKS